MIKDIPVLALTPGEPAGIGPECTIRLVMEHPELRLLAIADPQLLASTADKLGIDIKIKPWQPGDYVTAGQLSCFSHVLQKYFEIFSESNLPIGAKKRSGPPRLPFCCC